MPTIVPVLAEASANTYYQLARIQSLTEWWHWLLLMVLCASIAAYVVWMYLKDSIELPRGLAVLLFTLRLLAFFGILFYFFNLEKRAERKLVKNSRAVLLVDTSQSMGLRDTDASNVPAPTSRIEFVQQELARGTLVAKLRERHDVVIARFDEGENPVEIASYPRKLTRDEQSGEELSEQDRLNRLVVEARYIAAAAGVMLIVALIAGLVYLVVGTGPANSEQTSWTLLVSMTSLIAAVIILAIATLRAGDQSVGDCRPDEAQAGRIILHRDREKAGRANAGYRLGRRAGSARGADQDRRQPEIHDRPRAGRPHCRRRPVHRRRQQRRHRVHDRCHCGAGRPDPGLYGRPRLRQAAGQPAGRRSGSPGAGLSRR